MHPMIETRAALVSQLANELPAYDVLNGFASSYAKSVAIVIGDMSAVIDRDRFVTSRTLPFQEDWELTINIVPSGAEYSPGEAHDLIAFIGGKIIQYCAEHYTLGVSQIIRCQPSSLESTTDEQYQVIGAVTLSITFRIDRSIE